jgi:hypothetical protein
MQAASSRRVGSAHHPVTIQTIANVCFKMKNRRSIRLKEYDYSQSGAYFVTICTHNKECLFGEIVDGEYGIERRRKDCAGGVEFITVPVSRIGIGCIRGDA